MAPAATSSAAPTSTIAIPPEWPPDVVDKYTPIRILGKGGFASVILAKENQNPNHMVAIKLVGNTGKKELTYAHREVDILQELSAKGPHPNIMQVLGYWESSTNAGSTTTKGSPITRSGVLALSYAKGPTVESLLQYGGALSTVFSRVVAAQAIDAIAYLHYHAVIHRDIKPDNFIVTGAFSNDDGIWDNIDNRPEKKTRGEIGDGSDKGENESLDNYDAAGQEPDWGELIRKWKVTLVDFGFARALTPDDVQQPSLEIWRENLRASFHENKSSVTADEKKSSGSMKMGNSGGSSGRSGRGRRSIFARRPSSVDYSNKSTSHLLVSRMSALGNRNFAAPEIVDKVQRAGGKVNDTSTDTSEGNIVITDTVSEFVAEYGLLVDAYSMGFTLKYMMTGVLPSRSVEEAIAEKNSLCNKICGGSSKNAKRQPNYRRLRELPGEAQRLIQKMTERSEKERTSIRTARRSYPWISDVFSGSPVYETSEEQRHGLSEISYLPLATRTGKIDEKREAGSQQNDATN